MAGIFVVGTAPGPFGTGDADIISTEITEEFLRETPAISGLGDVVAIMYSGKVRRAREERYGEIAAGAGNIIRSTIRKSNEDFVRSSVETIEILDV